MADEHRTGTAGEKERSAQHVFSVTYTRGEKEPWAVSCSCGEVGSSVADDRVLTELMRRHVSHGARLPHPELERPVPGWVRG